MPKILKVECIGDDIPAGGMAAIFGSPPKRYWVAEITGVCAKFKYQRKFLRCKKDYSQANGIGSRGVYAYYILEDNRVYEVSSPESWRSTDRYFCTVVGGEIIRLTREEVDKWLNDTLAPMSSQPPETV